MLIAWFKAKAAAKRMGIRDRGLTGTECVDGRSFIFVHPFCKTRVRVGITPDGLAVTYCWRCEKVTSKGGGGDSSKNPGDLLKFRLIKSDDGGKSA